MNPYQMPGLCDVCGGEGVGRLRDVASQWTGGFISHEDPRICADVIRRKREQPYSVPPASDSANANKISEEKEVT